MAGTVLCLLPEILESEKHDTSWWQIVDGAIVASGSDAEWARLIADGTSDGVRLVALAPSALARVHFESAAAEAATPRQAEAIARLAAVEASLGDRQSLHCVSRACDPSSSRIATAVVDDGVMLAWLDWTKAAGADPHAVVPIASLLPPGDQWLEAAFGSDRLIAGSGIVLAAEPELLPHIVGEANIARADAATVDAALEAAAARPVLDLRTGKFARRRRISVDRMRVRELLVLASVIPLITLLWSIVLILKLDGATARIDAQTLAAAEAALGRPVALEEAEAELASRFGQGAASGLRPPLTATYQALEGEQGVSATEIAYAGDGTLSVTLAAPEVGPVNRVLIALQRNGYRITAVPRQAPDGRAMVDATVRTS